MTALDILKIIGFVLLGFIAFLLIMLILFLFVPVRYKVRGSYRDRPDVKANISFLLHIISVNVTYSGELLAVLRILGIPIRLYPPRKKECDKDKKVKEDDKAPEEDKPIDIKGADKAESESDTKIADISTDEQASDVNDNVKPASEGGKHAVGNDKPSNKKNKKVEDDKENIIDKIRHYVDILSEDSTKKAWKQCRYRLGRLIKHVLPRRWKTKIVYGLDDPFMTSAVMSAYELIYTYTGEKLKLVPVYDGKHIEADASLSGHVRGITVIIHTVAVLLDKNCRRFLKRIRG